MSFTRKMEVINHLLGYPNLFIVQDTQMLRFSLDSVLLAHFVTLQSRCEQILDIGCGNAPIPLLLSTMTSAKIVGIEIQPEVLELAKKSIVVNHLEDQISLLCGDVKEYARELESDQYDIILCNPPFFPVTDQSLLNDSPYKTVARHEVSLDLDELFKVAKKLLKNKGRIAIVHRSTRLLDVLFSMRQNNIEPKRLQLVYPKRGREANMILIEGAKDGKPGLAILPPIYVHEEDGSYTTSVQAYFKKESELNESEKL